MCPAPLHTHPTHKYDGVGRKRGRDHPPLSQDQQAYVLRRAPCGAAWLRRYGSFITPYRPEALAWARCRGAAFLIRSP